MALRIGTRGSKLALWQAEKVREMLGAKGIVAGLVLYKTQGDLDQISPLNQIGGRGLFTKVLDEALLKGEVDIVVHSAKDMASTLPDGIEELAFLKREDPRDVVLSDDPEFDIDDFSRKFIVGTSSVRRKALLQQLVPQAEIRDIRGNLDTRIEKMKSSEYDAILLAYAGVKRMNLTQYVVRKLNVSSFTPAPGQGAIAVVGTPNLADKGIVKDALNHLATEIAVRCERAFLRGIDGGCNVPAFCLATVVGDIISVRAGMAQTDWICRIEKDGPIDDPEGLGAQIATETLNQIGRVKTSG